MFFFDNTVFLLLPAIALMFYAQYKIKTVYAHHLKLPSENNLTGKDLASRLLKKVKLEAVKIELIQGILTDHYDSKNKRLGLSREVYYGNSIAAQSIVAHEIGHAIQDSQIYFPLVMRNNLVPVSSIGSRMAVPIFLIGFIFTIPLLMEIGIIIFSIAVLFHIITLPVEFDASKRALHLLSTEHLISKEEKIYVKKVLNAAALTYIAATAVTILQLLRLIVLRNKRG